MSATSTKTFTDQPLLGNSKATLTTGAIFPTLVSCMAAGFAVLDLMYHYHTDNHHGRRLLDVSANIGLFLASYTLCRFQQDDMLDRICKLVFTGFVALFSFGYVEWALLLLASMSLILALVVVIVNTWNLLLGSVPKEEEACDELCAETDTIDFTV